MKKIFPAVFLVYFLFLCSLACAQDDYKNEDGTEELTPQTINNLRPGMELRRIGGINMVVPQGTQVYKQGSMLMMEEDGDYSARRFKEMDERLNGIDDRLKNIETQLESLSASIKDLRK